MKEPAHHADLDFDTTPVALGVHAAPVMAQDAAIDAMPEYEMFSESESGNFLPQQSDQSVSEAALFVGTRDAGQFEEGTIPGAAHIAGREGRAAWRQISTPSTVAQTFPPPPPAAASAG